MRPRTLPVLLLLLAPALAAQDHGWFPIECFAIGRDPTEAVLADLDGDGVCDAATGNALDETISVLRGRGDGSFEPALTLPLGAAALALAAEDVTGDGRVDLVALSGAAPALAAALHVLPGLDGGEGPAFGAPVVTPLVIKPDATVRQPLALGDVNGDGRADAIVLNVPVLAGVQAVKRFGQPDGSFGAEQQVNAGPAPRLVALHDMDADAALDLLTCVREQAQWLLSVRRGTGTGTFLPAALVPLDDDALTLDVGALDGDGIPDVLVAVADELFPADVELAPFRGVGDGTLQAWPALPVPGFVHFAALGDIDGDGRDEIQHAWQLDSSVVLQLTVLHNDGDGRFEEQQQFQLQDPASLGTADLDADGHADLVSTHWQPVDITAPTTPAGWLSVRHGQADGLALNAVFAPEVALSLLELHFADVLPDGHADALASFEDLQWRLLPGDGEGQLGPPELLPLPAAPGTLATADFDGDGRIDVLGFSSTLPPVLTVLLNGPSGLEVDATVPTPFAGHLLRLADLDGDGDDDALLKSDFSAPNAFVLHRGDGTGHFGPAEVQPLTVQVTDFSLADVDGDGAVDIVAVNEQPGLAVLAGVGDGSFGPPSSFGDGLLSLQRRLRLGDLDHDGRVDIVTSNAELMVLEILLGRGDRTFDAPEFWPVPTEISDVCVADFDRDSRLDVAVSSSSAVVAILPGRGDGTFGPTHFYAGPSIGIPLVAEDVIEDGYAELACGNFFSFLSQTSALLPNRASPWIDLGAGLPASFGQPSLLGVGPGVADLPITLSWSGVPAPAQAVLIAGLSAALQPFHGGTLVPAPDFVLPVHPATGLTARWPQGVPAGTQLFVQVWFQTPPPLAEFAATNAVVLTTP